MTALTQAGTTVHEPMHSFHLEIPEDVLSVVLPVLARHRAITRMTTSGLVEGEIPVASVHALHRELPGLTRGEGVLESAFARYAPVHGQVPSRPRSDHNPLNRKEYLLHVVRRT
jgi:ribosomal protection tetracycline resistance protein